MPTFDFRCPACAHVFEGTVPFGSKKFPPCPVCKSKKTEKMLSAPGIVFKGGGFYKTDASKREEKPASKPAEKPAATPPPAPAPAKSDNT